MTIKYLQILTMNYSHINYLQILAIFYLQILTIDYSKILYLLLFVDTDYRLFADSNKMMTKLED